MRHSHRYKVTFYYGENVIEVTLLKTSDTIKSVIEWLTATFGINEERIQSIEEIEGC